MLVTDFVDQMQDSTPDDHILLVGTYSGEPTEHLQPGDTGLFLLPQADRHPAVRSPQPSHPTPAAVLRQQHHTIPPRRLPGAGHEPAAGALESRLATDALLELTTNRQPAATHGQVTTGLSGSRPAEV